MENKDSSAEIRRLKKRKKSYEEEIIDMERAIFKLENPKTYWLMIRLCDY